MSAVIYEGTVGLVIDVRIDGVDSLEGVTEAKLHVLEPGAETEVDWSVDVKVGNRLFRHIVAQESPLKAGRYRIQPSFRLGDFSGRFTPVILDVASTYSD